MTKKQGKTLGKINHRCVRNKSNTPLNITMVKIKNGSRQRGHVRYPNTKDTLK
jgi:hypothetical protein